MSNTKWRNLPEDPPHAIGRYVIAIERETLEPAFMGKICDKSTNGVTINPWNFLEGWIDQHLQKQLNNEDFFFLHFNNEQEMDVFFNNEFWSKKNERHEDS